jgi:hypothetical protein
MRQSAEMIATQADVVQVWCTIAMTGPAVIQVHPLSEARQPHSGILARFRREWAGQLRTVAMAKGAILCLSGCSRATVNHNGRPSCRTRSGRGRTIIRGRRPSVF